jgi:hypothetical protein
MKKIIKLIAILITAIIILFIFYSLLRTTISQPSSTKNIDLPSSKNILGTIEGSLGYPSDYIPEMKICAENIETKEEFCSYEQIIDKKFNNEIGYKIEAPKGTYHVYSQLINEKQKKLNEYKAYYSKFVTCGMSIECKSHKKIETKIEAGETTSGIEPEDWYNY